MESQSRPHVHVLDIMLTMSIDVYNAQKNATSCQCTIYYAIHVHAPMTWSKPNATSCKMTMHMVTPRHACTLDINIDHACASSKPNVPPCKMKMHKVHPRHACTLDLNIDHACTWSKPKATPCQCTICHANHRQKLYHASHRQQINVLYIMRTTDKNVNVHVLYIMLNIDKNAMHYISCEPSTTMLMHYNYIMRTMNNFLYWVQHISDHIILLHPKIHPPLNPDEIPRYRPAVFENNIRIKTITILCIKNDQVA